MLGERAERRPDDGMPQSDGHQDAGDRSDRWPGATDLDAPRRDLDRI